MLINGALPEATAQIKATSTARLQAGRHRIPARYACERRPLRQPGRLKKATGAQIVASAPTSQCWKPTVETPRGSRPTGRSRRRPGDEDHDSRPGRERPAQRDVTLVTYATPGHSPGSTTWTTVAREKSAITRQIFFCSISPPINKLVEPYPGHVDDYRAFDGEGIIADVFLRAPRAVQSWKTSVRWSASTASTRSSRPAIPCLCAEAEKPYREPRPRRRSRNSSGRASRRRRRPIARPAETLRALHSKKTT